MAKTYYSTRPPLTTAVVTASAYTSTPVNSVNIPGDYYITVNTDDGNITLDAGKLVLVDSPESELRSDEILFGASTATSTIELKSRFISTLLPKTDAEYDIGEAETTWNKSYLQEGTYYSETNVGNPFGFEYDPDDVYGAEFLNGDTEAANLQRSTASVVVNGGMGIQKDLNVGGHIYGRITIAQTSLSVLITATNNDIEYYPLFVRNTGQQFLWLDEEGIEGGLTYNPALGKITTDRMYVAEFDEATTSTAALEVSGGALIRQNVRINSTATATTSSGALLVEGGVSIGKNVYVKDETETDAVIPHDDDTGTIGTTSSQWAEAYVNDLYTKVIRSTTGTIQIAPSDPLVDIYGDIRVRGTNPIGTAPVVTNVLYVTMDGDDTNDGRAQDPSRACRTVAGAVNSPYYKPGTQIRVSAGRYYEDNPIRLKPYTSVMGSDIRTTFLEPINKTQDLFHVDSGCYLAFMNFLNGRSGLLEGEYANGFNRGAYCTAFPPLAGDDRIDLFQSPYVQNCTNQSGPWLKDGTLFVPNQTVQIPEAVAIGSWPANTTTIVVNVSTGTISNGMAVNAGQQNPGFFNARTLMLANKPFLQEQVVAYVDDAFNSGSFTYDSVACQRDLSVIVDSIAMDLLYNSDSDSIFAGLQYWSQGNISFPAEKDESIAAINYLKTLASTTATAGGGSVTFGDTVNTLFDKLTSILTTSTSLIGITNEIESNPNGLASTTPADINAYNALINYKATMQSSVIGWIDSQIAGNISPFTSTFTYNTATCARDVGYIIDSVAFDLLHGGNKQTIKSAIYYYDYDADVTQIANEVPQVTAAYNYLKSIIPNIVKGEALSTTYQTGVEQQISGLAIAGNYEADQLSNRLDIITDIIRNGPSGITKIPMNLTVNPSMEAENAYLMLNANKAFIKAEVTAYINSTANSFDYSREFCYRDVGILVENVAYDAAFGGNEKSVESGLAYYDGVISKITGQETQTISAIDYLNQMVQSVITNSTWTNILPVPASVSASGTHSQVRNTVVTGGAVASDSINNLFNIITNIIGNGPDAAPVKYVSSGPDAAYVSAEILLQANRKFIQEDTINYINNLVQSFPYSERKCRRDTKLIVDAISQDLRWPTTGMSQSTFAGLQYWSQGNYTGDIEAQLQPTIDAVAYLKDLAVKIIQNITPEIDLVNRYQSVVAQNTSTEAAGITEATIISSDFDIVLDILGGNKDGWTDRIIPNAELTVLPSVLNAYESLQLNKNYMAAEVLAYVDATHPDFTFSTSTCARDVGYIIDSICYDLTHNGNRQAIQAGLYYYGYNGSGTIQGQESATVDAYNRIYDIVGDILVNSPVQISTGNTAIQVLNLPAASAAEVTEVRRALTTITNIITSGPSIAAARSPISLVESSSTNIQHAYAILQANRDFIAEEIIAYVDFTYNNGSFNYNEELCYRDTGLIIDAVSQDIMLGGNHKSIEAGLAYWNQGYNYVTGQESTTTMALNHARDVALKVIANETVIPQTGTVETQVINTYFQYGGDYMPQQSIRRNFRIITDIIERGPLYAPPVYAGSGLFAAVGLAADDVKLAPRVTSIQPFTYDETLCRRDSGYIIDGIYYDSALGTNYNAVTSGNAYQRGVSSVVINSELPQTKSAIEYLKTNSAILMSTSTVAVTRASASYDEIINILDGDLPSAIIFTNPTGGSASKIAAKDQLVANKAFLQAETVAWINSQINSNTSPFVGFNYNDETCARDVGFIVDALCYDILYGGNSATRVCAQAYFTQSSSSLIPGETAQSVAAFQHMSVTAQNVIQGISVTPTTGTNVVQIISGSVASSPEVTILENLVTIITNVITAGNLSGLPSVVNPSITWASSTIQSAVNSLSSGKSTLIDNTITYINTQFTNTYIIGLSTSTVGFGYNSTLYFGDTLVYPKQDIAVPDEWQQRRVDPIGSMGGSLVDGSVVSSRSPIQSFVYDAFTQLPQGGRGVHIINDGYAQLVSVFTIFCSTGVEVESGGIASIVNSNANFGNICLQAKGYGTRKFSGHVYNPINKAYPESPDPAIATSFPESEYFDQYYPTGFWPNNAQVRVFLPDTEDRPHISLVMEIVPPETITDYTGAKVPQINEQGFPGFLNAVPTTSTLTTGTITITGIDTTGIAVGNAVYVRDLNNSFTGTDGVYYCATGTVVSNVGYQSVTLSKALTSGGFDPEDPTNSDYFNLYFCGNAYYTVLSSEVGNSPTYNRAGGVISLGTNVLSTASTGLSTSQVAAHISSIQRLKTVVGQIINNETVLVTTGNTSIQTINLLVTGGGEAETFIDQRFDDMINIIGALTLTAAEAVVKPSQRTKEGPTVQGAGSAITLIKSNIEFLADEISAYVQQTFGYVPYVDYDDSKCQRDSKIILERLIYDIETGGRYNSVMAGLSYWNRAGTYHIVQLGENVTRTDLFPDGATVNFYQRSYISASGYVFEYVGAGTNYGALPQRGVADPVQGKEVVMLDSGKVFFTSTDQNGDFRIGPGLVISQATGVLSGRTFTKSLFANMTPFILAIEAGG